MSFVQRFFQAVLPKRWADSMEAESRQWKIRCRTCKAERSVWETGGIRWGASSTGKVTLVWCSKCGGYRSAEVTHEAALSDPEPVKPK